MKKHQLKLLIKSIIKEAAANEILGFGKKKEEPKPTPQQQAVIDLLTKRGFEFEGMNTLPNSTITIARLSRPYGKGIHGGPRFAFVFPNGKINQDKHDVNSYLKIVGESHLGSAPMIKPTPTVTPAQKKVIELLVKRGWTKGAHDEQGNVVLAKSSGRFGDDKAVISADGKVNGGHLNDFLSMGESMAKVQKKEFKRGVTTPMGAVNVGEGIHDAKPCDCGSGEDSYWELDGRGIPLVRACPKCKQKKLSKYRPEILKPYTQVDVDEPIEPDDYEENISEMTATGAVAGYSTPYAFSKKKQGSSRAIAAAKKYGKVVKSISETEEK